MIPEAIHNHIRNARAATPSPPEDKSAFFWVEWNEDDDQIPGMCEAILKTGQLAADWDNDAMVIVWRGTRFPVALTKSPLTTLAAWVWPITAVVDAVSPLSLSEALLWPSRGDRHTTLLALNRALHPDYEIRHVRTSDKDELAFAPLAASDWAALEGQYGPVAVDAAFARLQEDPNLFADLRR
jgi:hypothetical protein